MRLIQEMCDKIAISGELFAFLWRRKMWWMMPIMLVIVFFGLLIGFGSASGLGPFVYPLL